MTYVDGVMLAVPTANKDAYLKFAESVADCFKKYGALSVVDCWGDDVPDGKMNSMRSAVLLKPDETVVFSWVTWPSKAVRDEGWEKAMADPAMAPDNNSAPFDGGRMIFGGFEMIMNK